MFMTMDIGPQNLLAARASSVVVSRVADFDPSVRCFADAGFTQCVDGDPVQEWHSDAGHKATQIVSAKKPVFRANRFGSHPAVRFDSDDILYVDSLASVIAGSDVPFTIVLVLRWHTLQDQDVLNFGVPTSTTPQMRIRGAAAGYGCLRRDDTGVQKSGVAGGGQYNTDALGHVWILTYNGSTCAMHVDGVAATSGFDIDVSPLTVTKASIGGRYVDSGDTLFSDVSIGRFMLYSGALTAGDRITLETNLKARYGTP